MPARLEGMPRPKTPAERAAYDAEKARLREERKPHSPGPGQYEPSRIVRGGNATMADMRGERASSAFQSKTQHRIKDHSYPDSGVDAGVYTPSKRRDGANSTLADMSGEHGSAAFKSGLQREVNFEILAGGTKVLAGKAHLSSSPGPASYNPSRGTKGGNATLADTRGEHGSSAFKSTAVQRGQLVAKGSLEAPGAGTYSPDKLANGNNATVADMRGEFSSASMRSQSAQISKPIPSTTSDAIGPGAYTPVKQKSGGNAELADATGEYGSSSFESGLGRSLPWN